MRELKADYLKHPERIDEIMIAGTEKARLAAKETMLEVREAMGLNYFKR